VRQETHDNIAGSARSIGNDDSNDAAWIFLAQQSAAQAEQTHRQEAPRAIE